jgi:hypothetical protein
MKIGLETEMFPGIASVQVMIYGDADLPSRLSSFFHLLFFCFFPF